MASTRQTMRGGVNPSHPVRGPGGNIGRGSRGGMESPREKFVRQMKTRTGNLANHFVNLRKLADREYYPHTERDLKILMAFLRDQLHLTEQSFKMGREISGGVDLPVDPEDVENGDGA